MNKKQPDVKLMKFKNLKPAEYNPRIELQPGDPEWEYIKNSIDEFDYVDLMIVNKDGTIISGHQRYNVMTQLGYTEALCVVVDVDKQKEKAMNLALNKIDGKWDKQKELELLLELDLSGYDLSLTGFEKSELELLQEEMQNLNIAESAEDDDFNSDEEYENIETPVTKRGDIWICGNHRIMCGDSTDPLDIEKLMD